MATVNDSSDDKATDQNRAIHVTYDLDASREKVWKALTEPKLVEQWLFPNDITPEVGRHFTFRTTPAPGFDGLINCEVKEVEAPRRLVYTWQTGPLDTVVNWSLESTDSGSTRLKLSHEGFRPEDDGIYNLLAGGWRDRSGALLKELVASM
ncbi:uncharacterized protein YndB with AHSA1/START domain [Neolewinella xylanilytica]|uniref:Uncharacterized protein YndB with AHSA1/START domain n=1 Tax=Neolewinella xylanilytica TaxID=1514080 RepID=A0A2S6I1A6_9BACT|nr:SRPBCC domain-containing protein [Neolewinella xylanilytica]PPK84758.1 uncharacterized protein YndB with AHSA1/START domain [Neolewinella xylanilytica]